MDEQTLEPCPFCGSSWVSMNHPANGAAPFVMCRDCCGAGGQVAAAHEDETIAVELWNTRAAHSVIAGKVAELTGLAAEMHEHARQTKHTGAVWKESWTVVNDWASQIDAALAPYPERRHE